ncbi:MAG: hypothetical protein EGR71_08350 [Clostridiales bacterium]|jgi:hypothetical protein|uniref:DUF6110 family protein n=1 Tax=Bovifimicola ammoniilytica TaxID=2981720 RepID=UPI00082031F1|nr:DUF6110 family protein [Bovifimicola ammoniilytica]MBD8942523.1 hypothetical protein [Clostridiales bacterium]MCU6752643.1 DUF6110 family protein [Bovifimicola ammoniilytica]SCJ31810.1 Uncharacterised protein [uncultured Eubacterium sp.]
MLKKLSKIDLKKTGIFASGVLFGTAGIKILSSKDAKKLYTNCTAAVLRAKETVMKVTTNIQENAEDILAEAKIINEERAASEAVVEDETTENVTEDVTEKENEETAQTEAE